MENSVALNSTRGFEETGKLIYKVPLCFTNLEMFWTPLYDQTHYGITITSQPKVLIACKHETLSTGSISVSPIKSNCTNSIFECCEGSTGLISITLIFRNEAT